MDEHSTEAGVIAELAGRAAEPRLMLAEDGQQFLVMPNAATAKAVTDPRRDDHGLLIRPPVRVAQQITLQTVASLVDYVNRFKGAQTTLFADVNTDKIVAVIDYHGPDQADHVAHVAGLTLQRSVEWKAWSEVDRKLMAQLAFARFIEENAADVAAPSGADLLEVCRDLQAVRKADFKRVVRTAGMDEEFSYTEGTEATTKNGSVAVPSKFQLQLPVYFGQGTETLFAFLRWELDEGALKLGVQLHRPEHVRQAVFQQIVLDIAGQTERQAIFGKLG